MTLPTTETRQFSLKSFAAALLSIEVWVVGAAVGLSFLSARWLPLAVAVSTLFWPLRWAVSGRLTQRTPADWGAALLALMIPVTLWATAVPEKTLPQVLRLAAGIGLYYAIANWTVAKSRLRTITIAALAAGLLLALFALISVEWAVDKFPFSPLSLYEFFPPLVSDTANPNVMAGNLVILLPLALALPLFGWKALGWPVRALAIAAGLAMSAILFLSLARGAVLALIVVLLLLAILRWRWGWLLALLAVVAGLALIQIIGISEAVAFLSANRTLGGLTGRQEIWSRAIYMIQDFPFTGIGMGSFTEVTDLLYPLFYLPPGKVAHAHNLFLQVAVDLGLPGLIGWLGIWMTVIFSAWQLYRRGLREGQSWLAGLGAGLLCSQLALGVHGMVEAVTWGLVRPAPVVWGLWGLAVAGWMIIKNEQEAIHRSPDTHPGAG